MVSYCLVLPPLLKGVRNVFHVLQLKRCIRNEIHILDHSELEIELDLSYPEHPVSITDHMVDTLKNKVIGLVPISLNWKLTRKRLGNKEKIFRSIFLLSLIHEGINSFTLILLSEILKIKSFRG